MWSDAPRLARQQKVVGTGSEQGCGVQQHPTGRCLEPPLAGGCCWRLLRAAATQLCTGDAQTRVTTGSGGYSLFLNFCGGVDIRRVRRRVAAEMFELLASTGCAQLCFTAKHAQIADDFVLELLLMDVVISFTQIWKARFCGICKTNVH